MSQANDRHPQPSSDGSAPEPTATEGQARPNGRYRFCAGRPVDPDEGVHPEMRTDAAAAGSSSRPTDSDATPASPAALIAMRDQCDHPSPREPEGQIRLDTTNPVRRVVQVDRLQA